MKKRIIFALCFLLTLGLTACGETDGSAQNETSEHVRNSSLSVSDIMDSAMSQADEKLAEESSKWAEYEASERSNDSSNGSDSSSDVDIDLTILSANMVYSQVSDMMYRPSEYIGKSVRMTGEFSLYQDPDTGMNYYACIVRDAMACCANGIEFVLTDDYVFPDDYPAVGSLITVVGVFDTYKEGNTTYCTLRNAELE